MPDQISVLFVCLGNICRSTMAEGVFQSIVGKPPYQGLVSKIDSCGTGAMCLFKMSLAVYTDSIPGAYHAGEEPDDRTLSTLEKHGITDYVHAARKVRPAPLPSPSSSLLSGLFVSCSSGLC